MAKVYLKFNGAIIKEYLLTKDETSFGRKPGNDIVIGHPTISGFHGKIKKNGDHYFLEDLNSTNGTFLNGQRVQNAALKSRDRIGAAGHIMEFVTDDAAAATQEPESGNGADSLQEAPSSSPEDSLEKQKELLRQSLGIAKDGSSIPAPTTKSAPANDPNASMAEDPPTDGLPEGVIKITAGAIDGQNEFHLKDLVTYIGTAPQALIKIKGFLAPELAAAISRRPNGYILKAVKPGYPKVNGTAVQEQVLLESGALIEVGSAIMVFIYPDKKGKHS